jgi:DNA processing protein
VPDTDPQPQPSGPGSGAAFDAMAPAELLDWLRLAHTPGTAPRWVRALLARHGTARNILSASCDVLAQDVPFELARALSAAPAPDMHALAGATGAWLTGPGHHLLRECDEAYPEQLRAIDDPPVLLYAQGKLALLAGPCLAIVGSRSASAQGLSNARAFAGALGAAGLTIVSGMALGIDAAAHEGSLRQPASTIAVIGTGIDLVYPPANEALARRIAQGGCIVSEYPLGTPARGYNFPKRNRIISALSEGVLVVEAAPRSGSLITAHVALEQGREVFAIPGSIHATLSKGCNSLIRKGEAKLVEQAADVLEELKLDLKLPAQAVAAAPARAPQPGGGAAHAALLEALGHDPVDTDTLAVRTGIPVGRLAGALLALELAGHIERLPGALIQRIQP